jgi:acetyl esterase/lipase
MTIGCSGMRRKRVASGLWLRVLACFGLAFGSEGFEEGLLPFAARSAGVELSKKTYTYKTVKDCTIQADVHRLPGDEVRPVILWIHGGALIFSDRGSVKQHQLQRYLQAGYVVVSIDYRLAPETKLPEIIEDLQDAHRWVREKGPELFRIDPDRVALVGDSAGGYLTLMGGFCLKPRPKALVSFYGYGDITGKWTSRPDPHYLKLDRIEKEEAYKVVGGKVLSGSPIFPRVTFYNYCRQNGLWPKEVAALDPDKEPEKLERFCPVRHVTREYPPTLLLHGDKDTDVPFEESVRMAAALERHQVPHQLIPMKNYDHLFDVFPGGWPSKEPPTELKDPKVIEAFDAVLAFLKVHIGR